MNKLAGQTARLLNGMPLEEGETRFAFDVFPQQAANLNLQLQKIFPQLDNVIFHQNSSASLLRHGTKSDRTFRL